MSDDRARGRQNWAGKVFAGLPSSPEQAALFAGFMESHDFAANTRRAMAQDVRKFVRWFTESNHESFSVSRLTTTDVSQFRDHLRHDRHQSVATVNRALVTLRRWLDWLVEQGHISTNPAKSVKELHRQQLAPKGLERADVRRLLREVELRRDVRANAIFHLFLFTGCRIGDLVNLEIGDVLIAERSGSVVFRNGKGNKQRSVPLSLPARRAIQAYLETRPPVANERMFVGERGPLGERGIRSLCDKYSALTGVRIYPHLLRHTFAHQFLDDSGNDLVALAQILGHENLNTTARYGKRTERQLADGAERLSY